MTAKGKKMTYLTIKPAIDSTRQLARSALPDAPVVPDEPGEPAVRRVRTRSARLLRTAARAQLRLAERMAPRPGCAPQPS